MSCVGFCRCPILTGEVELIDSPGISRKMDQWITDYCMDADVFVYVHNAVSLLNDTVSGPAAAAVEQDSETFSLCGSTPHVHVEAESLLTLWWSRSVCFAIDVHVLSVIHYVMTDFLGPLS